MLCRKENQGGVDGWISSSYHEDSELAVNDDELRGVYADWADSYDQEMLSNNLQSYKSVTQVVFEILATIEQFKAASPLMVLDAGCGTGLLGKHFLESLRESEFGTLPVHLVGMDLSPNMLDVARQKSCFNQLFEGSLQDAPTIIASSFDLIISSGIFLAGHCGPETIEPLLGCLRPEGYAIFTVRSSLFQEQEADFRAAIKGAGCELLQACLMPYYGKIEARVLTVKKTSFAIADQASGEWVQTYEYQGFSTLEFQASSDDLSALNNYLTSRVQEQHPGNVVDGEGNLRAVHGYKPGLISTLMAQLAAQAKTLLDCQSVYLYQFRINSKHPSQKGCGSWEPHRDYDFWQRMDGVLEPQLVVFHIFLTEQTLDNGVIVLCTGSHKMDTNIHVLDESSWRGGFREALSYTVPRETYEAWSSKSPMVGKAGKIMAMHPLTWHASSPNLSDANRVIASMVFNNLDNQPQLAATKDRRPDFIVHSPEQYVW